MNEQPLVPDTVTGHIPASAHDTALRLVLSTPLTACLVVLGRYVPPLEFLEVLLGDEPALSTNVTFYQRLLAHDQDEATDLIEQHILRQELWQLFEQLTANERQVLELRFGLVDDHEHTLEDVGQKLKVTRERVRQIQESALRKLRHCQSNHRLKDYLE